MEMPKVYHVHTTSYSPPSSSLSPLKFLRDGVASANFPAMPGLDPQACSVPNFFTNNFSNHLPAPKGTDFAKSLLKKKFWQASYCPQMVRTLWSLWGRFYVLVPSAFV